MPPDNDDVFERAAKYAKTKVEQMMQVYDIEMAQGIRDIDDKGVELRTFIQEYDLGNEVFDHMLNTYMQNSCPPSGWELTPTERTRILTSVRAYETLPRPGDYVFFIPIEYPYDPEDVGKPVVVRLPGDYVRSRRKQ